MKASERPNHDEMVTNLVIAFTEVSSEDRAKFALSYRNYYSVCASLADVSGLPVENVAACMAWLSPQQSLAHNIEMTAALVDAYCDGKDLWRVKLSAYPEMVNNAILSLLEGPFDMLWYRATGKLQRNKKVRNFFRNIMLDQNCVTIDRHAVAIAINNSERARNGRFVTITQPRDSWYDAVADAYRAASTFTQYTPAEFQAIVWCARRGSED